MDMRFIVGEVIPFIDWKIIKSQNIETYYPMSFSESLEINESFRNGIFSS